MKRLAEDSARFRQEDVPPRSAMHKFPFVPLIHFFLIYMHISVNPFSKNIFNRLREKEKLFAVFRDIERQMKDSNFELERDLYPENMERNWSQLMMLFQVRQL